ncbi:MAG TPA: CopD family protein [Steroidobacteraceae bacterium]|nr:CopD family protein [Steroidobacteraceae bacterium]
MLWLKALHIVFVVVWFAGIFYLPRLYIYHSQATDPMIRDTFKVMERRLFGMMTLGAVFTVGFGLSMLLLAPGFLSMPWMHAKLALVALLIGYHIQCYRMLIAYRQDRAQYSQRWLRIFNELPLIPLLGAILLVVLKPV